MEDFVEPANLIDCSIFPEIEKWGSSLAATHGWLLGSRGGGVRWWGVVKPPPRVTESALVSKSHRVVRHVSFSFRHAVWLSRHHPGILIAKT